jgi:hypothetical protein
MLAEFFERPAILQAEAHLDDLSSQGLSLFRTSVAGV